MKWVTQILTLSIESLVRSNAILTKWPIIDADFNFHTSLIILDLMALTLTSPRVATGLQFVDRNSHGRLAVF
jgi:hypothetical protein